MSRSEDLFKVNVMTNYHWQERLNLIQVLARWVCDNLNPNVKFEGSNSHLKKATAEGKLAKAFQYVYEYMAVGKMFHPSEKFDPLFTRAKYQDESMKIQLNRGKYPEFQSLVLGKVIAMHAQFERNKRTYKPVSWAVLEHGMSEQNKALMTRLRMHLCAQANEKNIRADWVTQQMIGLVLRYKCMGAFSNNLHGSIPDTWKEALGDDWVECFASPFNHKFDKYYSIYEQDKPFGSMGNFFSMISQNGGALPLCGKYEINPPWNNQMYEAVQRILAKTLPSDTPIEAIIVGPNWRDTEWIPGITGLIPDNPSYTDHSFKGVHVKEYQNDLTHEKFTLNTVYWVFSQKGIAQDVLETLDLPRPKTMISSGQEDTNEEDQHNKLLALFDSIIRGPGGARPTTRAKTSW